MRPSLISSSKRLLRQNLRFVKEHYAGITPRSLATLGKLTQTLRLSVSDGDVLNVDGKWYVSHAGLLRIALRRRCQGIRTVVEKTLCDPAPAAGSSRQLSTRSPRSRGFVGYGDADPSNVSPLVRGAEMRVAETRAVNRALRKAYGIGLCSVEELGSRSSFVEPTNGNAPHRCFREWFRS